jgi:hypothetical protein
MIDREDHWESFKMAMLENETDSPEFSKAELRAALKQVGRDARDAAFSHGQPVAILRNHVLVQVFADGSEVILGSPDEPVHATGQSE